MKKENTVNKSPYQLTKNLIRKKLIYLLRQQKAI